MKASELITLLQDAIDKYGDLNAHVFEPELMNYYDPDAGVEDKAGWEETSENFDGKAFRFGIYPSFTYTE
jgi:hypothetical protein